MREIWVQSLGWEHLLEEWQPTPVFWPGEVLLSEDPDRLKSMGLQSWTRLSNKTHTCYNWHLSTEKIRQLKCKMQVPGRPESSSQYVSSQFMCIQEVEL